TEESLRIHRFALATASAEEQETPGVGSVSESARWAGICLIVLGAGLVTWSARRFQQMADRTIEFKSRKVWSIVKRLAILGHFLQANDGGKIMLHLIWYIVVGLIAGVIAKSVMHVHMTIFWTIVLGIIGSIIGGAVTHLFSRPITGRYHPAGLIFSTLGAILVLYVCIKLNIRFPRVL